jgi:hypothetical protein
MISANFHHLIAATFVSWTVMALAVIAALAHTWRSK